MCCPAQKDCVLGVGGKDDATIVKTFQFSEEQQEKLRNWAAELKFRNEIYFIRAKRLLKNHPHSSHEDLLKLSYEYRAVLDSIDGNIRLIDKRMMGTFNDEQYNLYILLCNTAQLSPIFVNRLVDEKGK